MTRLEQCLQNYMLCVQEQLQTVQGGRVSTRAVQSYWLQCRRGQKPTQQRVCKAATLTPSVSPLAMSTFHLFSESQYTKNPGQSTKQRYLNAVCQAPCFIKVPFLLGFESSKANVPLFAIVTGFFADQLYYCMCFSIFICAGGGAVLITYQHIHGSELLRMRKVEVCM